VGVTLLRFTEQEVWLFTLRKWVELFRQYQKHHNFKVQGYIYKIEEQKNNGGNPNGWLPF